MNIQDRPVQVLYRNVEGRHCLLLRVATVRYQMNEFEIY